MIMNRTGNLWFAIFFHAAWNALQFISITLIFANYELIINFFGSVLLSQGAPKEMVEGLASILASILR